MPIDVDCPNCARHLRVPDSAAGRAMKCPNCSARIAIPLADIDLEPDPPSGYAVPPLPPRPAPSANHAASVAVAPAQAPAVVPGPAPITLQAPPGGLRVVVTDLDIKFLSLVWLMVKVAIAAIPAAVILAVIFTLFTTLMTVGLAALMKAVIPPTPAPAATIARPFQPGR